MMLLVGDDSDDHRHVASICIGWFILLHAHAPTHPPTHPRKHGCAAHAQHSHALDIAFFPTHHKVNLGTLVMSQSASELTLAFSCLQSLCNTRYLPPLYGVVDCPETSALFGVITDKTVGAQPSPPKPHTTPITGCRTKTAVQITAV